MNVNKSSVARQLAILEDKGYVRRESSVTDKRVMFVYPTEKALALKDRLFACYHDWNNYLTQDFTEDEKAMISTLMMRIASHAEDYVKGGDRCCGLSENM